MARKLPTEFKRAWESVGSDAEVQEKFSLQFKKLDDAVGAVIEFLGMQPCDNTHIVPESATNVHNLHLSGIFVGGVAVLVRSQLSLDSAGSVVLKIAVRSDNAEVSQMVADCIR
jgi:coatomer protein complex subunit gamma